ncbi:hypothetical protein C8R43DRAFT_243868 [Mycena crocata]|nr:hypothetical protein C8R43DRAFT_243868 [Mycena crocata]
MCLLGTVPGPNKPSLGRLNPFLDLIVRDFLEFWSPGVFFTRTHKYRSGRQTKAMLIPLSSDMLAARETAGFSSSTSTYFCICCHIDMGHIEEFDHTKWPHRDHQQHLQHAYAWKNALTEKEQERLAKVNGVRFSSLVTLPYWIAVRYVLVEPMHALDLDVIAHHCRDLFRIDMDADGGDGSEHRVARPSRPSREHLGLVLKLFQKHRRASDLVKRLLKDDFVTFSALWHICNDRNLRICGNRRDWFILRIKVWMDETEITDEDLLQVPPQKPSNPTVQDLILTATAAISAQAVNHPVMNQVDIQKCIQLSKALYRGTKFESINSRLDIFRHLCRIRAVSEEGTRKILYDRLMLLIATEKEALPPPNPEDLINRGAVLGRDVMEVIWAEMRQTILPSWVAAAPRNWGTAKRGKLSADHWRTIFTIHLPITLIWLWRDETGRKRDMLFNLTHLVVAILAANFKSTNDDLAEVYDTAYAEYMIGVAELFKENTITPSQHSAFHIGENLRDFGPQHSRGAQFYERYIHILQSQNTNSKFGEMEATL